ncbi:hypothetical protein ACFPIF_14350 [Brevundimonas faecalis]|uniref:hypothetical protein n=1 Tax=Brevundimonas faecalis TaxID=947378 RepID=UPI003621938F
MTQEHAEDAPTRTRRSEALWALARADYLAGGSAPEVCERHGLNLSTFRYRARVEGWRRADQRETSEDAPFADSWDLDRPSPTEGRLDNAREGYPDLHDPYYVVEEDGDYSLGSIYAEPQELADLAWLAAERAIRAGRMIEARGWTRIHRDLAATSRASPGRRAAHAHQSLIKTEMEAAKQFALLQDLRTQVARAKADLTLLKQD